MQRHLGGAVHVRHQSGDARHGWRVQRSWGKIGQQRRDRGVLADVGVDIDPGDVGRCGFPPGEDFLRAIQGRQHRQRGDGHREAQGQGRRDRRDPDGRGEGEGDGRLEPEIDPQLPQRQRRARHQHVAPLGQAGDVVLPEALIRRRGGAGHAVRVHLAVVHDDPHVLRRAVLPHRQRHSLEEINIVPWACQTGRHGQGDLHGAGGVAALDVEIERSGEGERPRRAAHHRQRQLILGQRLHRDRAAIRQLARTEREPDAVRVLDDAAVLSDRRRRRHRGRLDPHVDDVLAIGPQHLDIDEALGHPGDHAVRVHRGDAAVHRDIANAIGGGLEHVGQCAEPGDDGARSGQGNAQGQDRHGVGIGVDIEIQRDLLIAVARRAHARHRRRRYQPAVGQQRRGALAQAGQQTVRGQAGDAGIGHPRVDVIERHQHAGLVLEIRVDLDRGGPARSAEQNAQLVEIDMRQRRGADPHAHRRRRRLAVAVIGDEGERGIADESLVWREQQSRAVRRKRCRRVRGAEDAIRHPVAVRISGHAAQVDQRAQPHMRHERGDGGSDDRRAVGGQSEIGGDDLPVGGASHAVAVDIRPRVGSRRQRAVGAIDLAIQVDVARQRQRQRVTARRAVDSQPEQIRPADGEQRHHRVAGALRGRCHQPVDHRRQRPLPIRGPQRQAQQHRATGRGGQFGGAGAERVHRLGGPERTGADLAIELAGAAEIGHHRRAGHARRGIGDRLARSARRHRRDHPSLGVVAVTLARAGHDVPGRDQPPGIVVGIDDRRPVRRLRAGDPAHAVAHQLHGGTIRSHDAAVADHQPARGRMDLGDAALSVDDITRAIGSGQQIRRRARVAGIVRQPGRAVIVMTAGAGQRRVVQRHQGPARGRVVRPPSGMVQRHRAQCLGGGEEAEAGADAVWTGQIQPRVVGEGREHALGLQPGGGRVDLQRHIARVPAPVRPEQRRRRAAAVIGPRQGERHTAQGGGEIDGGAGVGAWAGGGIHLDRRQDGGYPAGHVGGGQAQRVKAVLQRARINRGERAGDRSDAAGQRRVGANGGANPRRDPQRPTVQIDIRHRAADGPRVCQIGALGFDGERDLGR